MTKNYRWFIGLMVLSLVTLTSGLLIVHAAVGDCDGTTGNDTINCTTNPVNPENQIDGDTGDDNITQAAGVTTSYIDADGQSGANDIAGVGTGGNDTIVNNGTVTVSISADFVTGKPGNDSVTNNGTTGDILGDETYDTTAQNGDDVIVNNGTVTGTIRGDGNASLALEGGNGGNDTITNNGTVGKDIVGDSASGVSPVGGNDTITNNGTVNGNIIADTTDINNNPKAGSGGNDNITNNGTVNGNIDAGEGNDTVTIGHGATVGGTINGGAGTDTLKFNFNDPAEGAAAATTLASMSPAGGTATFGGKTYTWTNFEQLQAIFTAAAAAGQPVTVSVSAAGQIKDGRVNSYDLGAPFAVYCVANEYVRVIDIRQSGNVLAFEAKFTTINKDITLAKSTHKSLGVANGEGDFLSADPNGDLVVSGPTLDGTKTYTFHFQADCSATTVGTES